MSVSSYRRDLSPGGIWPVIRAAFAGWFITSQEISRGPARRANPQRAASTPDSVQKILQIAVNRLTSRCRNNLVAGLSVSVAESADRFAAKEEAKLVAQIAAGQSSGDAGRPSASRRIGTTSAFEEHLQTCDECRAAVVEFEAVAESFKHAAPVIEPPPTWWPSPLPRRFTPRAKVLGVP